MIYEREDWETPDIPQPVHLTQTESDIVYAEISRVQKDQRRAVVDRLARYFDTTVQIIWNAYKFEVTQRKYDTRDRD